MSVKSISRPLCKILSSCTSLLFNVVSFLVLCSWSVQCFVDCLKSRPEGSDPVICWRGLTPTFLCLAAALRGTTTRDLYSHFGLELDDWIKKRLVKMYENTVLGIVRLAKGRGAEFCWPQPASSDYSLPIFLVILFSPFYRGRFVCVSMIR